jgi:hypothetical protein
MNLKNTFLSSCLVILSLNAQKENDYRREMRESDEKHERREQVKAYPSDYESYKKAKAWNMKTGGSTLFSNAADLDIAGIGGRVRSILVDKTHGIALVAPAGGGIWSFDPATNSNFKPLNDFGNFMATTTLSQDPFNYNHIIAATGDEHNGCPGVGLFESLDGGKTFSLMTNPKPDATNDFAYIRFVKFSPKTQNTIYMATRYKLYKSTNAGASWTLVFTSLNYNQIHAVDFLTNEGVIISVDSEGLYTSSTGNSFSLITKDIPNDAKGTGVDMAGVVVATHASNRNIAYTLFTGTNNYCYKTINGGTSWTSVSMPTIYPSQTWYCLAIGIHPNNPNIVACGGIGWAYTINGGTTWTSGAGFEVDFHEVYFHPSNPDMAYIGYDQGFGSANFAKYVDTYDWDGTQYVLVNQVEQLEIGKNKGFNTTEIYYGDYFPEAYGDAYIEGQQDGGCFIKTKDTERRIVVGDGGSIFINKQNPNIAFASTQYGNIKKNVTALGPTYSAYTTTGSYYNNHTNFITQYVGNNVDGNQLYFSSKTNIDRTLDGGANYSSIAAHSLSYVVLASQNSQNPVVYAYGLNKLSVEYNSDIIRIGSAATTPQVTTLSGIVTYQEGYQPDHMNVDPNDENTLYGTTTSGNAFKVSNTNGTPLKTSIKGDIPNVTFNTVIGIKNKVNLLIAGTNIGMFSSQDGGTTWTLCNLIPYTQVTDLKFRESDNRLFVFTYGRGAWAITLNTEAVDVKDPLNLSASPINILPNPATEFISIEAPQALTYTLNMYDVAGNKVLSSKNSSKINVSHIKSGNYIVHLENEEGIKHIQKIVIE